MFADRNAVDNLFPWEFSRFFFIFSESDLKPDFLLQDSNAGTRMNARISSRTARPHFAFVEYAFEDSSRSFSIFRNLKYFSFSGKSESDFKFCCLLKR